jgi:hypothetical protein
MRTIVVGISLWLVAQTPAVAQDAQQYSLALKAIRDTANDVCDRVSQEGQKSETKLSGDVEAKLNGVIGKVADLGLKGTGEFQKEQHKGVIQKELATVLMHTADCRKDVFDKLVERILPPTRVEPPNPPPRRVVGWVVTFGAKEQGGGSFRQFPSRTCVVKTPSAIDIRSLLPQDLSSRNVFIPLTANTDHQIIEAGRWVYYFKINGTPASYTQCSNFEVQSDGVPIRGGAIPILTGASSSTDTSVGVEQSKGMHVITIKLACYFQGGQFPVVSITLKPPSGQWRSPASGDFTVTEPTSPDKPPSALDSGPCVD